MSRTRVYGWGLLVVLAALPALLWMGSGTAHEQEESSAGVAISTAGSATGGLAEADGSGAGSLTDPEGSPAGGPAAHGSAAADLAEAGAPAVAPAHGATGQTDLSLLRDWLTGSFSSAAQATADSAYFDIRLHVVPIWRQRNDAHWLYVEQAAAARLDKPYRMRVYKLVQLSPDLFESQVYKLPNDARFAGAWNKENPLGSVTPDSLLARAGCSIVLRKTRDGAFMGSTLGHDCESDLRGAAYAVSEVRIEAGRLLSWDRGFNTIGKQAWGAEKGPYEFLRVKE
jgi:CpeT protein